MIKQLVYFIFFVGSMCGAKTDALSGSLHGDRTAVDYRITKSKHTLSVRDTKSDEPMASIQIVDLNIKRREHLAIGIPFRCEDEKLTLVYGVFKESDARETSTWAPIRAWRVDEKKISLEPVVELEKIKCKWVSEDNTAFPFKK